MGDNVDGVNVVQEVARERAHRRAAVWHAERFERLRILRVMQRPVGAPVQRRAPPQHGGRATSSTDVQTVVVPEGTVSEDDADSDNAEEDVAAPASDGYISPGDTDGLGSVAGLDSDSE